MGDLAADPLHDQLLRDAAVGVAQSILNTLTDQESAQGFIREIAKNGYAVTKIDLRSGSEIVKALDLPRTIRFDLIFMPIDPEMVAGFIARSDRPVIRGRKAREAIMLNVLPPMAAQWARQQPLRLWMNVLKMLEDNPGALVHEATHMLDHFRGGRFIVPGRFRPVGPENLTAYVNSPVEFNAFFQQGVFDLRQHIEDLSPSERRRVMSSFERFTREASRIESIQRLRELARPKLARKIDTRLWQTYRYWKENEA